MAGFLNRYTSLPVLLDALVQRRLTLLSPEFWEDRNDAYYLAQYKERRSLKTVLALCFSNRRETFHHWKVFSSGVSGVCIEFDKDALLVGIAEKKAFRAETVKYKTIKQVKTVPPRLRDLPFLKRKAFEDEGEFRIVYRIEEDELMTKDLPFKLGAILRITLSPWMPEPVANSVITVLRQIKGCDDLWVTRSILVENASWKAAINEAIPNGEAHE